jgi:hypothetical protein
MLKLIRIIGVFVLFVIADGVLFAQQIKDTNLFKQNYAIQFNYAYSGLEELIWHDDNFPIIVYALRNGYNVHPNIQVGPEFSGFYFRAFQGDSQISGSNSFRLGGYSRFTLNYFRIVRPFAEIDLYYNHYWSKALINEEWISLNKGRIGGFVAPGFTLYFAKNRISLDLMWKFSNEYFVNSKHRVFSWRLSYNFNYK